jgi:hypothetical protein
MSTRSPSARTSTRLCLAADLHRVGLRTASDAVARDLAALAPAIVRELRAAGHEALVADVLRWESDATGADLATLTALAATTGPA